MLLQFSLSNACRLEKKDRIVRVTRLFYSLRCAMRTLLNGTSGQTARKYCFQKMVGMLKSATPPDSPQRERQAHEVPNRLLPPLPQAGEQADNDRIAPCF